MKNYIIIIIVVFYTAINYSQSFETPKSFAYLNKHVIDERYDIIAFLSNDFKPQKTEITFIEAQFEGEEIIEMGLVKISKNQKTDILMAFSNGQSEDPAYLFFKKNGDAYKYLFSIEGQQIFIPGNGYIYASGIANEAFDKKMKFKFENENISEVKQPLYYVGIKTKTKKTIRLYSDKTQTNLLATLPKNAQIEIVASEFTDYCEYYLIKSSFGLMGWWKMDNWYSEAIENFYVHGD